MKSDTLHRNLMHIEGLQIQVDLLKNLKESLHNAILEERLSQASETFANFSSLSTAFGTMYTIIGAIISI